MNIDFNFSLFQFNTNSKINLRKIGDVMATTTLSLGSTAPDFNLISTDGNTYSLNSLASQKLLIIVFSCNHCPYVQAYEDRIIALQEDFKDTLQVVAISSNDVISYPEDSLEEMKKRASARKFNFPYLWDEDQSTAKAYGATHTPEIFLFDSERKLIFHGKVDDNWQDESAVKNKFLRNAIDENLSDKKISVPETFTIGCTIKWKKI